MKSNLQRRSKTNSRSCNRFILNWFTVSQSSRYEARCTFCNLRCAATTDTIFENTRGADVDIVLRTGNTDFVHKNEDIFCDFCELVHENMHFLNRLLFSNLLFRPDLVLLTSCQFWNVFSEDIGWGVSNFLTVLNHLFFWEPEKEYCRNLHFFRVQEQVLYNLFPAIILFLY